MNRTVPVRECVAVLGVRHVALDGGDVVRAREVAEGVEPGGIAAVGDDAPSLGAEGGHECAAETGAARRESRVYMFFRTGCEVAPEIGGRTWDVGGAATRVGSMCPKEHVR